MSRGTLYGQLDWENQQQERTFGVVMLGRQTLQTVYTLERHTGLNTFCVCVCKRFPLALNILLN
jgi:hypothetical protein